MKQKDRGVGLLVGVVWVAILASGCAPAQRSDAFDITAQVSPGMTTARFRTYAWRSPARRFADPVQPTQSEEREWWIRNAIDEEMRARGLAVASHAPDLLVDYRSEFAFKQSESFQEYGEYRRLGGTLSPGKANVLGYQEVTLSIVLLDPSSEAILWRGIGRAVALESGSSSARIREAIRQIFEKLP